MPPGTPLAALLLLALAGGFMFASRYLGTRYRISRAQGQEIIFYAAAYAIVLLAFSFVLLWLASALIPAPYEQRIGTIWKQLLGPVGNDTAAVLPPFLGAFILGLIGGPLLNRVRDAGRIATEVIFEHGSQLERFLYTAMLDAQLLFVGLESRKVYVGWVTLQPKLKPQFHSDTEYFGFLPARSGYLDEKTLEPHFTAQYGPIYEKILDGVITYVDMDDFDILLPMDRVVVIRPYSLDLPQEEFVMSPGQVPPAQTSGGGTLQTLLILLMVWRIIRRPTRN